MRRRPVPLNLRGWGGGKTLCVSVSLFDPRKMLPKFYELFFFFLPFFIFFCFRHPAVVVREIILRFFLLSHLVLSNR